VLAFDMHMDSCSFGDCGRQLQSTQIMRISGRELGAGRGRRLQLDGGGHERKEECGGKRACPTLAHACHTLPAHNTDSYIQRMILLKRVRIDADRRRSGGGGGGGGSCSAKGAAEKSIQSEKTRVVFERENGL